MKKWIEKGEAVAQIQLQVKEETKKHIEGFAADASERADKHMETFSQAALLEEKVWQWTCVRFIGLVLMCLTVASVRCTWRG